MIKSTFFKGCCFGGRNRTLKEQFVCYFCHECGLRYLFCSLSVLFVICYFSQTFLAKVVAHTTASDTMKSVGSGVNRGQAGLTRKG